MRFAIVICAHTRTLHVHTTSTWRWYKCIYNKYFIIINILPFFLIGLIENDLLFVSAFGRCIPLLHRKCEDSSVCCWNWIYSSSTSITIFLSLSHLILQLVACGLISKDKWMQLFVWILGKRVSKQMPRRLVWTVLLTRGHIRSLAARSISTNYFIFFSRLSSHSNKLKILNLIESKKSIKQIGKVHIICSWIWATCQHVCRFGIYSFQNKLNFRHTFNETIIPFGTSLSALT